MEHIRPVAHFNKEMVLSIVLEYQASLQQHSGPQCPLQPNHCVRPPPCGFTSTPFRNCCLLSLRPFTPQRGCPRFRLTVIPSSGRLVSKYMKRLFWVRAATDCLRMAPELHSCLVLRLVNGECYGCRRGRPRKQSIVEMQTFLRENFLRKHIATAPFIALLSIKGVVQNEKLKATKQQVRQRSYRLNNSISMHISFFTKSFGSFSEECMQHV